MQIVDIYCRVSGDMQEENTSLDEQERASREFCQKNGLTVGMVHHEIHTGYQYRERQKLTLMRQRMRDGVIQGIVVWTVDRFTRKQVHAAILLEELEHYKCKFYSVIEPEADDSVMGQFVRMVLAFIGEMEREKIMDRTIMGRINAAKAGKVVAGNKLRYGWKWHDVHLHDYVEIDEPAAEIVRWAAQEYADGVTCVSLCSQLNERGVSAPKGNTRWVPRTLRRILSDIRNTGKGVQMFTHPQGKRTLDPVDLPDGTYPALFDEETYQRIILRARANQEEASRNGSAPENYLLRAGFMRCANCKHIMVGCMIRDTRMSKPRFAYVCQKTHACPGYRIPAKQIDDGVWAELVELADHISLIEEAVRIATNQDHSQANIKAVERALADWKDKVTNYMADLDDHSLRGATRATIRRSLDDALEMVERLEGEKQKLMAGEYNRQKEREAYGEILDWCRKVRSSREELTYQKKRDYLRMLGVVVFINRVPRKKGSEVSYDIQLALPALQELVHGSQREIVGLHRMKRR